jgi:hypothetical protein
MTGHLEATAALNAAAEAVPLEMLSQAEQGVNSVAEYSTRAGGRAGEQFTQESLAAQEQIRHSIAVLAQLRQKLQAAAIQVQNAGP